MGNNKKKRNKQRKDTRAHQQNQEANASVSVSAAAASTTSTGTTSTTPHSHVERASQMMQALMSQSNRSSSQSSSLQQERGVDSTNTIFTSKLHGAFARLFANGCMHFLEAVLTSCNDAPDTLTVWIGLSPQQRIRLVTDVMIGLLCDKEPLEAIQTEKHFVAYLGILQMVATCLEVENDMEGEKFDDNDEGLLKLEAIRKSFEDWRTNQPNSNDQSNIKKETKKERNERLRQNAIKAKIASRQKKKLEKKINEVIDADNISDDDNDKEEHEQAIESISINDPDAQPSGWDRYQTMEFVLNRHKELFLGGPPPESLRTHLKPDRKKDVDVYYSFQHRIMCDEAFQENDEPTILSPIPLKYLNFNWKLNDCGSADSVWTTAIYKLFLESGFINYDEMVQKMVSLHYGQLTDESYVNRKNHQRVIEIEKTTRRLRSTFDESYDETQFCQDQRCIFSICSIELFAPESHRNWLIAFLNGCHERNFPFVDVYGHYQERLELYRSLSDLHTPTTFYHPYPETLCHPKKYSREDFAGGFGYEMCNRSDCFTYNKDKLMKCGGCRVVKYCSPECQKMDWKNHKKHCQKLAAMNPGHKRNGS